MPRKKTAAPPDRAQRPTGAATGVPVLVAVHHPALGTAAVPAHAATAWAAEGWSPQPPASGAAPTSDVAATPDPDGPDSGPSRTSVKEH